MASVSIADKRKFKIRMKRLFTIGGGLLVYSIIPILCWLVLSFVLGDNRISNVFSITYAIQFVWSILKLFFGSAANIRKGKEGDSNAVMNGIFWGTIISALIFSIPLIFVDQYIAFFGQDVEFYRIYVILGIALLFLQTLFSLFIEKLYFEDKEKKANVHLISFNMTTFVVLVLTALITKNPLISTCVTLGVLVVYLVFMYVKYCEKFKIDFSFFKNIKYESANIISSLFSMIIYLFGYKIAFAAGEEYLIAITVVGLCTDAFWDALGAVSTVAKVDISKGRFEYRKQLKESNIFACVIVFISIAMTLILSVFYQARIDIVLIFLAIQAVDMLLDPCINNLSVFTQLEYSPLLNTILTVLAKLIRTPVSIFILSPYCTEIGQIVQCVLLFTSLLIVRVAKYKVVDGRLIVKENKKEGQS